IISALVIFAQYLGLKESTELGMAMAFSTLIIARIMQTLPSRSNENSIVSLGLFTNKFVLLAMIICFGLYSITLTPFFRQIFYIPLAFDFKQLCVCLCLGFFGMILMEIIKIFRVNTTKQF
ncbi:MAG: cation transporting ATPase C-terminal domain-containing protein, partial [Elusimicrobiota bacterium]|nr:cation transporting ATPase C-terminal domain-containing protein [Elusimicrobiota bacterium]